MARFLAYSPTQAARVTSVPVSTLRAWERADMIKPHSVLIDKSGGQFPLYSFENLVALRVLWWLRNELGLANETLKAVWPALHEQMASPWSTLCVDEVGVRLKFTGEHGDVAATSVPAMYRGPERCVVRKAVERDIELLSDKLQERTPDQIGRVEPLAGEPGRRPVIAGTRIPTIAIWEFHEAGYTPTEIIEQYPRLTNADVASALAYEAGVRSPRKAS